VRNKAPKGKREGQNEVFDVQRTHAAPLAIASASQHPIEPYVRIQTNSARFLFVVARRRPEYLMASTPHDFKVDPTDPLAPFSQPCGCFGAAGTGDGAREPTAPGAFGVPAHPRLRAHLGGCAAISFAAAASGGGGPVGTELLEKVLLPVAEARGLPVAIKIGAHREVPVHGGDCLCFATLLPYACLPRLHRWCRRCGAAGTAWRRWT